MYYVYIVYVYVDTSPYYKSAFFSSSDSVVTGRTTRQREADVTGHTHVGRRG